VIHLTENDDQKLNLIANERKTANGFANDLLQKRLMGGEMSLEGEGKPTAGHTIYFPASKPFKIDSIANGLALYRMEDGMLAATPVQDLAPSPKHGPDCWVPINVAAMPGRFFVIPLECPHCKVKQAVHVAAKPSVVQMGDQMIACVECKRYFDVIGPNRIISGPFEV
jgi:hypothetical protein